MDELIIVSDAYREPDDFFWDNSRARGEFGRLNQALNRMLTRIEADKEQMLQTIASLETANEEIKRTHQEVVRAEKLASAGRLSAGIAHEIGNPVSIVSGYLELLQQPETDSKQRSIYINKAVSELERIDRLIRGLLDYARSSSLETELLELDEELFESYLELAFLESGNGNIEVKMNIEPGLCVIADREALRQVILNCSLNAIDAIMEKQSGAGRGTIQIDVSRKYGDSEEATNRALISVCDDGGGIDAHTINNVFEPFFTTKEAGRGTGLGLYVSKTIIESFNGTISMEANQSAGVTVIIELPSCKDN